MAQHTNKFWFSLAVVAIVFLLAASTVASGQGVVGERKPILLSGYMTCGTNPDGTRVCPFRHHYVELAAGRTYMIRMESSEFDPYLVLEDIYGKQLASVHDDYDSLYDMMVFRPATSGTYRLVGSCLTPEEGFYTITLRELPVILNVEADLTAASERIFDVALTAGRRYIIDMESDAFDGFVKVMNDAGTVMTFADECGPLRNTRVVFEPTASTTYRIVATATADRATGPFRLIVCEE
jgi:hypothetical protein